MKYQALYKAPGVCEIIMADGTSHTLDFSHSGGAFVLEAVLAVVHGEGEVSGINKARATTIEAINEVLA